MLNTATSNLDLPALLALAAALGWASGVRLYAVVFITGMAGWMGWFSLPAGLSVLQCPWILGASGFMLFIEFFADKIPAVDSLWDVVHTVIRIPAGAALAAAALGADSGVMNLVAAIVGGSLAATSHATKATSRAALNTSPEPFSNIGASLIEDGLVPVMLWLAVAHPFVFFAALAVVLVCSVVLLRLCWQFLRVIAATVRSFFGSSQAQPASRISPALVAPSKKDSHV